ncbi:hypothetical protein NIA73_00185 [Anaerobutyricum hallii]|nr:hypothetical protein [Anaerobutyricum hallii]
MDVIEKFGNRVSSQALKDPEKARRLLLAGYRLQEKEASVFAGSGAAVVGTVCGAGGYEKYHSVAVGTGECGDGQHICAGRVGDGGRADAVLSGGDVLFYGGNEV